MTIYYVVHNVEPLVLIPMGDADEDLQGVVPGTLDLGGWSLELLAESSAQPLAEGHVLELDDGYLMRQERTDPDRQATEAPLVARQVPVAAKKGGGLEVQRVQGEAYQDLADGKWLDHVSGCVSGKRGVSRAWILEAEGHIKSLGLVLAKEETGESNTVRARHLAAVRTTITATKGFCNPYNFVPLPSAGPSRSRPKGHLRLDPGNLSGRIDFVFKAVTKLALPGPTADGVTTPYCVNGELILPGSSIGGAVRSFHEALTGSCLRVIDPGFRPVHREPPRPRQSDWRLGVVQETARAGIWVKLCDLIDFDGILYPVAWVEGEQLPKRLSSTSRFRGKLAAQNVKRDRLEADGRNLVADSSGPWVPLVTAKGARGKDHPYHVALGTIGSQLVEVPERVQQAYALTAEDAEDVVKSRRKEAPDLRVFHRGFQGTRQQIGDDLPPGAVIWVRLDAGGNEVLEVSRSAIWRMLGDYALKERVSLYMPCRNPDELCPSCALFGMVEEESRADRKAEQNSYRGHVRFADATVGAVETHVTTLVRMGQPRPGSSQFYLENPERYVDSVAAKDSRPLRDWGSDADLGERPRQIRGRKFYWASREARPRYRHPSHDPKSRYVAVEHTEDTSDYHLVPDGTEIKGTAFFDNITRAQLGALLMSLRPQLFGETVPLDGLLGLPDERHFVLRLGRGKNVGLGAVKAVALSLSAEGASRYGQDEETSTSVAEAAVAFTEWVHDQAPAVVGAWPALAAMSLFDRIPERSLAYPPDDTYSDDFQFDFWKSSSGVHVDAPGGKGFTPLPRADAPLPFIRPRWWGHK